MAVRRYLREKDGPTKTLKSARIARCLSRTFLTAVYIETRFEQGTNARAPLETRCKSHREQELPAAGAAKKKGR